MKRIIFLLVIFVSVSGLMAQQEKITVSEAEKTLKTQWDGKRVAYLGDSMSDPDLKSATTAWYWQYLKELMNIDYTVYAKSGLQWDGMHRKVQELYHEKGDSIDAIFIWAGTNDYNQNTLIGDFFTETMKETNYNGVQVNRKHRTPIMSTATFCGRINLTLSFLKEKYPDKQIVILTPIHRSDFTAGETNVQPNENFANGIGLYLEDYVNVLKQAGTYWAVPVIDLHSLSGIFPLYESYAKYCTGENDKLHVNALGHYRIAKTIQYQLLGLTVGF